MVVVTSPELKEELERMEADNASAEDVNSPGEVVRVVVRVRVDRGMVIVVTSLSKCISQLQLFRSRSNLQCGRSCGSGLRGQGGTERISYRRDAGRNRGGSHAGRDGSLKTSAGKRRDIDLIGSSDEGGDRGGEDLTTIGSLNGAGHLGIDIGGVIDKIVVLSQERVVVVVIYAEGEVCTEWYLVGATYPRRPGTPEQPG